MLENSSGGGGAKCFPAGWNVAAPKPCDSCKSSPASLFCRKDVVFLCMVCDLRLHNETRHERVWMCEVCEQSPAGVTCKADAALLCFSCDRDIHSVNPLARRHERVPVVPFYDSAEAVAQNSTALNLLDPISDYGCRTTELNSLVVNSKEDQVSWKIPMSSPVEMKAIDLFSETDILFDFGFAIPTEVRIESQIRDSVHDAVVPVQRTNFTPQQMIDLQSPGTRYDINFTESNTNSYSKSNSQSLSDLGNFQVSSTSMNVGVVPEQNKMLDVSYPLMLPVYGGSEFKWTTNGSHKATCKDRLARVLRYREKRKNRKYEKKIRYASRKAYADMRPRVKGRFAKRTEATAELDADRWLFTVASTWSGYGGEVEYGVVPSF